MPRRFLKVFAALLCSASSLISGVKEAEAAFNVNLLTNGNAESGVLAGNIGGFDIYSTPGWTNVSGAFEAETYAQGAGSVNIGPTSPGPTDRGALLFYGGDAALTVSTQTINVAADASVINSGKALADISGWLGGFFDQDDNARFTAIFLGAKGNTLGSVTIGPVLAADRGGVSGLLYREADTFLPVGTISIEAELTMTRGAGTFNNAAADNLNISLTAVPEPASVMMTGISSALGLFVAARRRRTGR